MRTLAVLWWPLAIYDGTNGGNSSGWAGGIGSLQRMKPYKVIKLRTPLAVNTQAIIAGHSPSYWQSQSINYYIDPDEFMMGTWYQSHS